MSEALELKIDGPRLTPEKFEAAVKDFFAIISGVAKNVSGTYSDADWKVEVDAGSTIVRVRKSDDAHKATVSYRAEPIISAVQQGFIALSSGLRTPPPFFTRDEIRAVKDLAELIDKERKFVSTISIKNGDRPVFLSEELARTAEAILSGERQICFGSVEGYIETFHRKENQPFTCYVREPIYRRSILCTFSKSDAEEVAYRAFRPPKRVLAYGLIHYAKEGFPTRIDVDTVRIFPEEDELPSVEEIQSFY